MESDELEHWIDQSPWTAYTFAIVTMLMSPILLLGIVVYEMIKASLTRRNKRAYDMPASCDAQCNNKRLEKTDGESYI